MAPSSEADRRLAAYVRSGRHRVRGWLKAGACTMVCAVAEAQTRLGVSGGAAEIGVYHGKLFVLLYLLLRGDEPAVAVDLFEGADGKRFLRQLEKNLRRHADTERLIVHTGDSMHVDSAILLDRAKCRFRLFSIDGGHDEGGTAHDLATARGSLAAGGVIILDDCFNPEWPGVSCGVHRYFGTSPALTPFAIGANKVLFCEPGFQKPYYDAMLALRATKFEREYLGSPVVVMQFDPPLWKLLRRLRWIAARCLQG